LNGDDFEDDKHAVELAISPAIDQHFSGNLGFEKGQAKKSNEIRGRLEGGGPGRTRTCNQTVMSAIFRFCPVNGSEQR